MESKQNMPGSPAALPALPAPGKTVKLDGKDRLLLAFTWLLGIFFVQLLVSVWRDGALRGIPALGMALFVAACYAVLFWYAGPRQAFARRNLPLLVGQGLLLLCLTLYSNVSLRLLNYAAICLLAAVQLFQQTGLAKHLWTCASVLGESMALTMRGLFGGWDLPFRALHSFRNAKNHRALSILAGTAVSALLIALVLPFLLSADAVFHALLSGFVDWVANHFGTIFARLFWGALLGIMLYSLLYYLRNGEHRSTAAPAAGAQERKPQTGLDPLAPSIVLAAMDGLYLFFLCVQSAVLFGGERYLAAVGISYAEYARSGFFQLAFLTVVNLTMLMTALRLCRGGGSRAIRIAGTVLMGESAVLLLSAALRMSLYVSAYGLSCLRMLTYWGIAVMAVFLVCGVVAVWNKTFRFFPVLFSVCLYGWILLNFVNMDAVIARYNVNGYLSGTLDSVDASYLSTLSYDTIPALRRLPGGMAVRTDYLYNAETGQTWEHVETVDALIAGMRAKAAFDAAHWEQWSVSAALAAP